LLVFYVGYILDDKNSMIGSSSESSFIRTMFISKHVTDHKLLEDLHEEYLQIPSQINRFLCNRPDTPQCLPDYVEDVRTSEQHRPDAWSIIIQHRVGFQKLTLLGKSLQASRTTWQHVRTLCSISKYSSVLFEQERS